MTLFGKWLGWGMLLSCLIGVAQAQPLLYQEGQHYLRLPKPLQVSDSPQEVVEMFSYRCPHCFSFEPVVESWLQTKPEGVAFVRIPVGFGRASWELMARTYYAAQELGVAEQMDHPLFDAIHVQRKPLATPEEIAEVFAEQGISADDFLTAFKSFTVETKMRRGLDIQRRFQVRGVPMLVVNGEFVVTGESAGSSRSMFDVANFLLSQGG
ncbi:MAG: thiol:disulfide interchange protein DsbA/DsbL [Candidatus Competibacteraceae bacterium]|nr:thiol:disulfide interchange protein DsbA/DsbL [Candidatus Competibacteraceae bacterium]MCB1811067.1 thiol:disulfide interchange protein DsbA/DsbL [Candidatus Competibacteraceae bacterium]